LSESSDDDSNLEIKLTTDDLMPLLKDPEETNVCTQQLMGLCSGQFQTQKSEEQVSYFTIYFFSKKFINIFCI
jgi:hypothetical protein